MIESEYAENPSFNQDFISADASFSSSTLDALGFGVAVIEAKSHKIVYINNKVTELSGYELNDLVGQTCHRLLCPAEEGACPISDLGKIVDNSERDMLIVGQNRLPIIKTVIPTTINGVDYFIESLVDNTDRKLLVERLNATNNDLSAEMLKTQRARDEIEFLAYHDHLTSLPNKVMLTKHLEQAIRVSECSGKLFAVLFLDLDEFKMINDTLGHTIGDQLLVLVSKRLASVLRKTDFLARIGGDEFLILIDTLDRPEDLNIIASNLVNCFRIPFMLDDNELYITTSIGIAVFPADGDTTEKLIKNADIAMYKAKEKGRNQWEICTSLMKSKAVETMQLGNQLYRALDNNEFELYYQPQINCSSNKIIGLEALIRWNHPQMGQIPPGKFIPIAEHTGLIHAIGDWVIREACRQNKLWQDSGLINIPVAVNLSMRQFQNLDIVRKVSDILDETGLAPEFLELEITESIVLNETNNVVEILSKFREMGITIAIDDFGTEYSSLNYLKQLPVDRIKIAMPFVQGIDTNQKDEAITKAILVLAKSMGLKVIAEGVEKDCQFSFLSQRMCDDVQGFLFYKPMPVRELEKCLK